MTRSPSILAHRNELQNNSYCYFDKDVVLQSDCLNSNPRIIHHYFLPEQTEAITELVATLSDAIVVEPNRMASGKTQRTAKFIKTIKDTKSVIGIAPKISLTRSLSKVLELLYYEDVKPREFAPLLASCLNSIPKHHAADRYDCAVFDEFRQSLETMLLASTVKDKRTLFAEMVNLFNNASLLFCLDADFNEFCLQFLLKFTNKQIHFIHVQVPDHKKKLIELKCHNSTRKKILAAARQGKQFPIICDSKNQLEKTYQFLTENGINTSNLWRVDGDNTGDAEVRRLFEDPNGEAINYQILMYSPAMQSGVSITAPEFTEGYAMFGSGKLAPNELVQMLGRCRCLERIYISFSKTNVQLETDMAVLAQGELIKRERLTSLVGNKLITEIELDDFEMLQLKLTAQRNAEINDLRKCTLAYAETQGYSINRYETVKLTDNDKSLTDGLTTRTKEARIEAVMNAPVLTPTQAEELENTSLKTRTQSDSLHRHKTTEMAVTPHINSEDVKHYLEGAPKVIKRHRLLTASVEEIKQHDVAKIRKNGRCVSYFSLVTIVNEILALLKNRDIRKADAIDICKLLVKHSAELSANGFVDYSHLLDDIESDDGKQRIFRTLTNFLGKFGYKLFSHRRDTNGKRERIYRLEVIEHIAEYAARQAICGKSVH
jgi:hypothetical protein